MFGFTALAEFTHHCETAFNRVREGDVIACRALMAAILSAQDHIRVLIEESRHERPTFRAATRGAIMALH